MDCNPTNSSVCGILQARILEWVSISFSRGSSQSRCWIQVSCFEADSLLSEPLGKLKPIELSHCSGAWKSEMKVRCPPAWLFSGCTAVFFLGPHMVFLLHTCANHFLQRHQSDWIRPPIPKHLLFIFIISLKALSSNAVAFWGTGISASIHVFWRNVVQSEQWEIHHNK